MLVLVFQVGGERYALDANKVVEVVPFVALRRLPQAPRGVAGLFSYYGQPVPAVDLSELFTGQPASEQLSTRILILNYRDGGGVERLLGIIAERATEMLHKDPEDFRDPGVKVPAAPALGPVLLDARGSIQWLDHQSLLPAEVAGPLFQSLLPP
jgi:chemotaxis-related protein WspB